MMEGVPKPKLPNWPGVMLAPRLRRPGCEAAPKLTVVGWLPELKVV